MSTRLALSLGLALSLMVAACGGDGTPPGDDTSTPDGHPGSPDAHAGSPDASTSSCADLAGVWTISGQCGADLCTITQVGCAITQLSCTSGAHSTSGTIAGDQFSYTGVSGGGLASTCSGTANGNTLSGSCTVSVTSCTFTGIRN